MPVGEPVPKLRSCYHDNKGKMDKSVLFTPQRESLPLRLRRNTIYLNMPVPTSPVSNLKCCDSLNKFAIFFFISMICTYFSLFRYKNLAMQFTDFYFFLASVIQLTFSYLSNYLPKLILKPIK